MATPEAPPSSVAASRNWSWGVLALLALAWVVLLPPAWQLRVREAGFDALQSIAPRVPRTDPVVIVAIDEKSLAALGQWPWPRTVLADLLGRIAQHHPAAVGIDVLMSEPDRLSPAAWVEGIARRDPELAARLALLPGNDQVLAEALAAVPVVLAAAGAASAAGGRLHAAPVMVSGPPAAVGASRVIRYPAAITNLETLDRAAAGHGIISAEPTGAIYRRFALVYDIGGTLVPSFAVEMLRVGLGQSALRLRMRGGEVERLSLGELEVPTERDGAVRIHFAREPRPRSLSAVDVLEGRAALDAVQDRLVLIGPTAVGLGDLGATPLGELMPGVEIHAQLIENLVDRTWLRRPAWAPAVELVTFVLLGIALVWATPRWSPVRAAALAAACATGPALAAAVAFRSQRLLLDATPGAYLLALFGLMTVLALADAASRRRSLERALQAQREREAFVTGELAAARRIQTGMLPAADALPLEPRVELAAEMVPAREVGGDLYDYLMIDERHLYFMVGDVSGKGVAASLFMAVAKSLCKSIALRDPGANPQAMMTAANAEIGRDNGESLFVTAFVGKLDLATGELACCNAGHDEPLHLPAGGGAPQPLVSDGGPPLCVLPGFVYAGAVHRLCAGDAVCLVSDGVTEARQPGGQLYGRERLNAALSRLNRAQSDAKSLVAALRADVQAFVAGAEPADDLTVLVVRWLGPAGSG